MKQQFLQIQTLSLFITQKSNILPFIPSTYRTVLKALVARAVVQALLVGLVLRVALQPAVAVDAQWLDLVAVPPLLPLDISPNSATLGVEVPCMATQVLDHPLHLPCWILYHMGLGQLGIEPDQQ